MIEGVETKELKVRSDDRGWLFEALRKDDKLFEGEFGQLTISTIYPGAIKAFHRHSKQTDYTCCVKGNVKLVLVKEKKGENEIMELLLGEKNPVLVKIPPGVWHGYTSIGGKEATIAYLTDKTYDPEDEERKSFDSFGVNWGVAHK